MPFPLPPPISKLLRGPCRLANDRLCPDGERLKLGPFEGSLFCTHQLDIANLPLFLLAQLSIGFVHMNALRVQAIWHMLCKRTQTARVVQDCKHLECKRFEECCVREFSTSCARL